MFTVFLVDDDPRIVKALTRVLQIQGFAVRPYTLPQQFLAEHDAAIPGCALLDVSLPGLDGLELQETLTAAGTTRPVVFITGQGDIPTSVRAMKAGAVDFLTKPVDTADLLAAIRRAEELDARARQLRTERASIEERLATLTPREREVMGHVVVGRLNKQIAFDLGTVEKTIKFHRGAIMRKMGARSALELVRMVEKAGVGGSGHAGPRGR